APGAPGAPVGPVGQVGPTMTYGAARQRQFGCRAQGGHRKTARSGGDWAARRTRSLAGGGSMPYNRHMNEEKFSDRGYKKLFSHPRMVELLVRSFVAEDFVDDFDFTTLKRLPTSYVTDDFRERESDILWQVTLRGRTVYIFLLIEFQSSVDRFMAL